MKSDRSKIRSEEESMRFVIPLAGGRLTAHFGHCEQFAVVDADPETGQIMQQESLTPPPHQPGLLPPWLAEQGAEVIIAGGMGVRAQQLFAVQGIQVVVGAAPVRRVSGRCRRPPCRRCSPWR
jgi:predicted Fe-Mo cluster-binding NifX family protein